MNRQSKHALRRQQQRGISPFVVEMLMRFGAVKHDHHGCMIRHWDSRSTNRLSKYLGKTVSQRLLEEIDAYAVIDAVTGELITVGHRTKRIRNH